MIFPPTHKSYEFGDHCTIDDKQCNKNFNCGSCDLAWKEYKKDLEENDYAVFVIPDNDWSKNGITAYNNAPCTIAKVNSIEDLFKRFTIKGVPFKPLEKDEIDTEEMRLRYPYLYALKTLENLGEPLSYQGGNDIPIIVEYPDSVYMIAPMKESE